MSLRSSKKKKRSESRTFCLLPQQIRFLQGRNERSCKKTRPHFSLSTFTFEVALAWILPAANTKAHVPICTHLNNNFYVPGFNFSSIVSTAHTAFLHPWRPKKTVPHPATESTREQTEEVSGARCLQVMEENNLSNCAVNERWPQTWLQPWINTFLWHLNAFFFFFFTRDRIQYYICIYLRYFAWIAEG